MFGCGRDVGAILWAVVRGWQLTLAGCAIVPVFVVTMAVQSGLVAGCEVRNKRARAEVARGYYDVCFFFFFQFCGFFLADVNFFFGSGDY